MKKRLLAKDALLDFPGAIPRTVKRGKGKPKVTGPKESIIQRGVEQYLDLLGIKYIRIPDSLYRTIYAPGNSIPIQAKAEISRCIAGVPDLIVLRKDGDYNNCLLIELKRKGGAIGPKQKKFAKDLNVNFCYSIGEAKKTIDEWRKGND